MTAVWKAPVLQGDSRDQTFIRWYLALEAGILLAVQLCKVRGVSGWPLNLLMYGNILINTAVVLHWARRYREGLAYCHARFIAYGLLVTTIADALLTLLSAEWVQLPGVALFCVVQGLYAAYLGMSRQAMLVRLAVFAGVLLVLALGGGLELLTMAAALDIVLLLCNVVQAWSQASTRTSRSFCLGLTLFLYCDVCVGLNALSLGSLSAAAWLLVWLFYAPSQVLITLTFLREVA